MDGNYHFIDAKKSCLGDLSLPAGELLNQDGISAGLDSWAWTCANRAYVLVFGDDLESPSTEEVQREVSIHERFLDDEFFPELLNQHRSGRATFLGADLTTMPGIWRQYDWVQKHEMFLHGLARTQYGQSDPEEVRFIEVTTSLAILERIENAAVAVVCDDTVGLCQCIGDAHDLAQYVPWIKFDRRTISIPADFKHHAKQLGAHGSDVRHQRNRAAKEAAIQMYIEGGFKRRADAVRRIAPVVSREPGTVKKWFEERDRKKGV